MSSAQQLSESITRARFFFAKFLPVGAILGDKEVDCIKNTIVIAFLRPRLIDQRTLGIFTITVTIQRNLHMRYGL